MNKKTKTLIVIGVEVAIIIAACGYLAFGRKRNKTMEETWGNKYYVYLNDVVEQNKYEEAGLPENTSNVEMSFIDSKAHNEPEMVLSYENAGYQYSNIYYIQEEQVKVTTFDEPSTVMLLYNKDYDKTNYYLNTVENEKDNYTPINNDVLENDSFDYMYSFDQGNSDFDDIFVDMGMDFKDVSLEAESLFDTMNELVEEYQTIETIVEEEQEIIDDFLEKQEEKKEQEQQKQEESVVEEPIVVEESVQEEVVEDVVDDVYVTGSHTLAYGRYYDSIFGEVLNLNRDGTFTYTDNNGKYYEGTFAPYQIQNGIAPADVQLPKHDGIVLNCSDGNKVYFMVDTNNVLYDQWHSLYLQ